MLVPLNGSQVDEGVIRLAVYLARKKRAKLYAIYVTEVRHSLPLDARIESEMHRGEEILSQAEQIAEEEDYEVEAEHLQAREVGPAIVDEAVRRGIDLVLVGTVYKKRFGEFRLGEAITYVLRHAPCPVLVYREPPQ